MTCLHTDHKAHVAYYYYCNTDVKKLKDFWKLHGNISARYNIETWLPHTRPLVEQTELECGQMPNVMVALPNTGGALCSTPQSLAVAHYWSTVQ